jgi:serine/threonine protein phosphatase 1
MKNQKIIAFGDIHGVFQAAHQAVNYAESIQAQAIFLGDYVDRGKESIEVIELLIDAKKRHPDWKFLIGNHDFMLLNLIQGKEDPEGNDYKTKEDSFLKWMQLASQKQNSIAEFLSSLDGYYENDDFIFVHGILRETNEAIQNKTLKELIWNYEYSPYWSGKYFIHGHLPVDDVKAIGKGININTSCGYAWGHLTGLEYEKGKLNECRLIKIDKGEITISKN